MVLDSGCDLLFHTMIAGVTRVNDHWRVLLCTKLGLKEVFAKVLIDCTGDANLVQMAGYPATHHPKLQPGTLLFQLAGYDPKNVDIPSVQRAFDEACNAGTMRRSDAGWSDGQIERLIKSRGFNAIHVCDIDASDSEGKTHAEVKGRRIMLEVYQFLKQFPGMEGLTIATMQPECGIRETRIIEGETCITLDDYWNGRVWEDSVCYSFYPIDLHTDDGLDYRELQNDVVPTIPRGAMIPQHSLGLLAPGRHMCGDRMAHSAFRVQSTCMATGQAAAAIAVLAIKQGCEPRDVPMIDVRSLLVRHGAIVPPKVAVETLAAK
ncbi:MAG: FAD-dependent oxidoreductase [Phycisphaerales bacterium]|nr:FAD-dependent oxidoreductase [Phycisphaerales bacterium]